jgi:hypothetical protein
LQSVDEAERIEDTIHIRIFFKIVVRRFLKVFRQKYLKIKKLNDLLILDKDFSLKRKHGLE